MSVLSRPLFRQMGGPAQPMPQDMAPAPPPMAPPQMNPEMARQAGVLEQAEMEARATGEQLGAEYAQKMMAGIDGAQSTEDLINALRGNDRPLDARRDELAGYVGQSDAEQTPESVLAMVQPVIMMTEEGIMDSGIGNLMQQITGEVDMMTESGQPTDMGQGVGSLMMAGAPEAPAPQNFREGGAVQKFQAGGAADNPFVYTPAASSFLRIFGSKDTGPFDLSTEVKGQYDKLAPLFQEILGDDAERLKANQAQGLLSIARGGLRLAAGDPEAGGSFASQVGAAFEPVAGELATLGAQQQQRKDAVKQAALTTALSQADDIRKAQLARSLSEQEFIQKAFLKDIENSFGRGFEPVYFYKPDTGEVKVINKKALDAEAQSQTAIENDFIPGKPPQSSALGSNKIAKAYSYLAKPENLQHLESYFATPSDKRTQEQNLAAAALNILLTPEIDPDTGFTSTAVLPDSIVKTVEKYGMSLPATIQTTESILGLTAEGGDKTPTSAEGGDKTPAPQVTPRNPRIPQVTDVFAEENPMAEELASRDMGEATGLLSGPKSFLEFLGAQAADVLGEPVDPNAQVDRTRSARRGLEALNLVVEQFILDDQGRPLSNEFATIQNMLAKPSMFQDDRDAYDKISTLRSFVAGELQRAERTIEAAKTTPGFGSEVQKAQRRRMAAQQALPVLDAALRGYTMSEAGVPETILEMQQTTGNPFARPGS